MTFTNWLRGSFDGMDGRASSKKLSLFAFTSFYCYMLTAAAVVKYSNPEVAQVYPDIAWIMTAVGAIGSAATQVYQSVSQHRTDKENPPQTSTHKQTEGYVDIQ